MQSKCSIFAGLVQSRALSCSSSAVSVQQECSRDAVPPADAEASALRMHFRASLTPEKPHHTIRTLRSAPKSASPLNSRASALLTQFLHTAFKSMTNKHFAACRVLASKQALIVLPRGHRAPRSPAGSCWKANPAREASSGSRLEPRCAASERAQGPSLATLMHLPIRERPLRLAAAAA